MGEIQLKNWAMRLSVGGVRVDGLRVDDASGIYWHSSSIVKRINSRLLETSSGSRYRLLGDLDEIYAKEVSDYLCSLSSQFRCGFPKKWKYLIEFAARAQEEVKSDGGKQRKDTETFRAPDNKIPLRPNKKDGKSSFEISKSVSFIGCHTNRKTVLCKKRISKETPVSHLYSVTRSMTKKLEQKKMRNMSCGDGSRLEDTFDGTILALTTRSFSLGRTLRKRKQPSGFETAAKKRKVEGHNVVRSQRPDWFPTPELQNNDIVFDSFSSQRTSVRNRRRMISTAIEPDILTLEGILSPPEDASEKMFSSQRTIVNPVIVPLDLDEEIEEDVLQKSFLEADFSERRVKQRSRTVQPKQRKAATKKRKSMSLAPSKSRPVRTLRSVNGGHNLRPRTVKKNMIPEAKAEPRGKKQRLESKSKCDLKNMIPEAKAEPRGKKQRLESKSKCDLKKHQPNENVITCINDQQLENDAASRSRANHKAVTTESGLVKGSAKQRCKVKLTSKKDSQNLMSVKRVKPIDLERHSLSAEVFRNERIVKPVTQSKILATACVEPCVADMSVVTESMKIIHEGDGGVGQRLMENCQDQARLSVHESLMTMATKHIPTAKMTRPKKLKEKEASNDVKTLALKEKKKNKDVVDRKVTSVARKVGAGDSCGRFSVTNAQTLRPELHDYVTSLDSKPVEESESRSSATVSALNEKGESVENEKSSSVTRCSDADLKSRGRQVAETPHSFRKVQGNSGRFASENELKIKKKAKQSTPPNVVITDTNGGSLKRIGVPVRTSTPKPKKTVVKKKKTGRKNEIDEEAVIKTNEIENGQRSLSTQRLRGQLEEKISKTKAIPLLPSDSVLIDDDVVEECCLASCPEETVAVDINVMPPKQKKKSRKVAEVTGSVINVMNQLQKSQPKSDQEQMVKMKTSEKNDSIILAKKNDQITNVKLLGGRGTLKRQKELRKLVEANMHCEANNDFFSSTPFQSPRARRFAFPKFEDDDDIFAGVDLGGALNYDMTDVTPHGFFRVMDYTANKTPASTTSTSSSTPAVFKRRRRSEQEAYNHRVKKILHLGQRKVRTSRNVPPKKPRANYEPATGAAWKPVLGLDKDLFEVKEVRDKDEEEEDFYFADD